MKRHLRLFILSLAAVAQTFVPLSAYGHGAAITLPNELCSAVRGTTPADSSRRDTPAPDSGHHHCAQEACCADGATKAAAPPTSAPGFPVVGETDTVFAVTPSGAAPHAALVAALPRGPPPAS